MDHPKLHDEETVIVEPINRFGRTDYVPCNQMAFTWLKAWDVKSFSEEELKFITSIGYCVLIQTNDIKEFGK